MKIFCSLIFAITLVNASKLHLTPLILTTLQHQLPHSELQPARQQYHNQDSKGFYSYGYRGETSAKAEYKSVDGTAKGFYAYVDTNGKLQQVEYVAGRQQGFKASANNLPKAPVDNRRGPAPVKDTIEVQMAKKAHFEAYRAAEMRAALATNEQQTNDDNKSGELNEEHLIREQQEAQEQEQEQRNMLQTNELEQQKLMLMMANMNGKDNLMAEHEEMDNGSQEHNIGMHLNEVAPAEVSDEHNAANLMTSYRINNIAAEPELSNLLQSYSSAQPGSSIGSTTHARALAYLPLANTNTAALHSTHLGGVHLPLPTYYTTLTPATSYTLAPTVLTSLPRLQSSSTITTTLGHIHPQRLLAH